MKILNLIRKLKNYLIEEVKPKKKEIIVVILETETGSKRHDEKNVLLGVLSRLYIIPAKVVIIIR